ncbi:unnamed protein product [Rangifer tarandus platyrhynchus]|uniref:Uncharacterized protein n=2 Tax=Rangifer tarandus platyrhynchus TaxID=3082113 RepID=A0ACB0DZS8_RANTA|nr:unnamed protein product [Rangifer tarandus platyrhynchus]CAI9693699.1 unnamed protein product [Rangifer tarandus platyrhynchus]
MGRHGSGEPGGLERATPQEPQGAVSPPPLGAGCRPLGPHRGARSPRERGCVEGRGILADLPWVRWRQRPALPWDTRVQHPPLRPALSNGPVIMPSSSPPVHTPPPLPSDP